MPSINGDTDAPAPERLQELTAKATALYGMKDYTAAAEAYSEATELQAEINGEMNVENADLLYAYGRCLFFVAQKTSTVLGGTATQAQLSKDKEKKVSKKRKASRVQTGASQSGSGSALPTVTETPLAADVIPESEIEADRKTPSNTDQPLFQITGDENWTDSEDEEDGDGQGEEEDEEEDDFANSFELLDLARILYLRNLDSVHQSTAEDIDEGKYIASISLTPAVRDIKSRVADIYDLQAEIGLEGEKYSNAVSDLRDCLALREELELPGSSMLAECHYKLSLALEVAAQDQQRDPDGNPVGDITIDWDLRKEALLQQEKAIDCCKLRVSNETANMEKMEAGKDKDTAMSQIEEVQEMIGELEDRLTDLRKPPVSVKAETEKDSTKDMMAGVLGQIMGAGGVSKEEQREQLAKVMAGATDLSGMVKKKGKQPRKKEAPNGTTASKTPAGATPTNGTSNGIKRKAEDITDEISHGNSSIDKRAKVEDVPDSGT